MHDKNGDTDFVLFDQVLSSLLRCCLSQQPLLSRPSESTSMYVPICIRIYTFHVYRLNTLYMHCTVCVCFKVQTYKRCACIACIPSTCVVCTRLSSYTRD